MRKNGVHGYAISKAFIAISIETQCSHHLENKTLLKMRNLSKRMSTGSYHLGLYWTLPTSPTGLSFPFGGQIKADP